MVDEIEVVDEYEISPLLKFFNPGATGQVFEMRIYNQAKDNDEIKQWPDAKNASNVKIDNMYPACKSFFFDKQVSDEKAAQYKKEINTHLSILKKKFYNVCCNTCYIIPVKKKQPYMEKENGRETVKPQPVKVGEEYSFLLLRYHRRGFSLRFCISYFVVFRHNITLKSGA